MPEKIDTDFVQWFIKNEYTKLDTTKIHVAFEGWCAGFKAAQQLLAPDSLKAGAYCLPEFDKSENALPAESG